jgi:UDP-N-acetylmuramate dehydrogenase
VQWAQAEGLPLMFLGGGSNLLISDRGLPGLTVLTKHLRYLKFEPETGLMIAGAGRLLPQIAGQAAKRGLAGFEWAVGIPGTVGGAVVMNAGAHGGCTADSLVSAQVLGADGRISQLSLADLNYSYRSSVLQGSQRLVLQATFQLQPGIDPGVVKALTQQHLHHRLDTQPYHLPSCGSVFRNPSPRSAGWLIENTGLKGYQIGQAQVAERHANFILNCGGATASDIYRLIHHVQARVSDRWSVLLKPEVKILGDFAPDQ